MSQRPARAARVLTARLDLEWCRVVAPFDAWVTNMNISEGAYARPGTPLFTLIDTRKWWVVANYRESKLRRIKVGTRVDVYLLDHPDRKFNGIVESVGFGVFPEDGKVVGGIARHPANAQLGASFHPISRPRQGKGPGSRPVPHRRDRCNHREVR